MKVLQESGVPQILKFIPRSYPSLVDIDLIEEGTNQTATFTGITATTSGSYLSVTEIFVLTQGNWYSFDVTDNATGDLIYRGRIFCTNQDIDDYTINNSDYTVRTSKDNKYVQYDG
jgi:hypothetical protein